MGVNIKESELIAELERDYISKHKESFAIAHVRQSLLDPSHIPYYKEKYLRFIETHGE